MKFFIFYLLVLCLELSEAFFLFPEKHAIFLCLKVCPLYCSKRQKRDAGVYWDDSDIIEWPPTSEEEPPYLYHPYHVGRWSCRKSTTTTTTTTTEATTTQEPTWICEVCQKKCGILQS